MPILKQEVTMMTAEDRLKKIGEILLCAEIRYKNMPKFYMDDAKKFWKKSIRLSKKFMSKIKKYVFNKGDIILAVKGIR